MLKKQCDLFFFSWLLELDLFFFLWVIRIHPEYIMSSLQENVF